MADNVNFFTDEQVALLQEMADDYRRKKVGTTDFHEAPEYLDSDQDSNNHFIKTPLTGIPPLVGTLLGHATCNVYKPVETFYRSGEFNLVAVTLPNGSPYQIEVYNSSEQQVEYGYYTVDRERYGVYAIHMVKGALVLVEAKECIKPNEKDKEAWLFKLTENGWVKTDQVIELSDRLDANMLVPGDKVFAMPVGPEKYDIVGSHGLYRWAKPNANIECNASGSVTLYTRQTEQEENEGCGTAVWTKNANGEWELTSDTCTDGCVPIWPDPDDNSSPQETPCQGYKIFPPPSGDKCGLKTTDCVVDVCNSVPPNRCYKSTEYVRIRYMGRDMWEILPFKRNSMYIANIAGAAMCGQGNNEEVEVTNVQPLEFCMTEEELQAITSAKNRFALQGIVGDYILLIDDLTRCTGDNLFVAQVLHKCRYQPTDSGCAASGEEDSQEQKFLRQKEGACAIEGQLMKMAIQSCVEQPTWKEQIALTEYELLYDAELYMDTGCLVALDGASQKICAFPSPNSGTAVIDLGSIQFVTQDVIANPLLELDTGQGTGTDTTCENPFLLLKGQKYAAMLCEAPYPEPEYEVLSTLPLHVQDALVEASQTATGCPQFTPASFIVFAFCEEGADEPLDCDECPPEGGTGSA